MNRPTGARHRYRDEWQDLSVIITPNCKAKSTDHIEVKSWTIKVYDNESPNRPTIVQLRRNFDHAWAWRTFLTLVTEIEYGTFDPKDWKEQHVQ